MNSMLNHTIKWKWTDLWWVLSIIIGFIGVGYACYIASGVFYLPKGSYIRPIGPVFAIAIDALVTFLTGFPLGIVGLFKSSHKRISTLGALLNLLPYPTFLCITKIGIVLRDLHLSG
ncbi:MAG: hypothetical protein C0392_15700 [Syntrophus sp. (in: bacteria)]|nr:hypothetical protein [Syntrophus sp. (in: bacteria)]